MTKYMRPFKDDGDIGLFLVNFERVCTQIGLNRDVWALSLMTVLPTNAAEAVARLDTIEASNYEIVKASLLKKYKLSAETYRRKFRRKGKGNEESFSEFAYNLKANFTEWIKVENADSVEKLVQVMCLEQFYSSLSDEIRFWVEDKNVEKTVERAADLADEYVAKRGARYDKHKAYDNRFKNGNFEKRKQFDQNSASTNKQGPSVNKEKGESNKGYDSKTMNENKYFENKRIIRCYVCKGPHFASQCDKSKPVLACIEKSSNSFQALEPYMLEADINGKVGRVLRDSGATHDVVKDDWVNPENYTGKTVWLRVALSDQNVCLPVAKITLKGKFGVIEREAAVTKNLPESIPYLLSNKQNEDNETVEPGLALMLTRSKAKKLILQNQETAVPAEDQNDRDFITSNEEAKSAPERRTDENVENPVVDSDTQIAQNDEFEDFSKITVNSKEFNRLITTNVNDFRELQKRDESLEPFFQAANDEKNLNGASFYIKSELLYRRLIDKSNVEYTQLVIPTPLRKEIIHVGHNNSWAGHLGARKTLRRIRMEFWWPQLMRDVKLHIKACDTCMRVGKPNEVKRQPLKLVPIVTEPYQRIIVDVVGPLRQTDRGNKYILTSMCSATKFTEATPMKIANSETIVLALLDIFARVGFPEIIQTDQGSVFKSALTTTFLESCGIKMVYSSVSHPQSNPVERFHSTLKRILRGLCYEKGADWDLCLPAALFAIRSAPHESTGFSPAELLYGRQIRGPLNLIRESWDGTGVHQTVVEYVINLLEKFRVTRELVERNAETAKRKAKTYYDKRARYREFKVGDRVLTLRPMRKDKLAVHWEGPEKVVKRISDTTYVTETLHKPKKKQTVMHINLLKPYHEDPQFVGMSISSLETEPNDLDIPELEVSDGDKCEVHKSLANLERSENLSEKQVADLKEVFEEYKELFSEIPGSTSVIEHDIELVNEKIIASKPYPQPPKVRQIIDQELDKMIKYGKIKPSNSPYSSPMLIVQTAGKDPRPVIDYRKLNQISVPANYPIPNIEQCVEKVSKAKFVTTIDLVRGYWQVPMSERARKYAAFITHRGVFEPTYMTFGLQGASFTFQKLMDRVLGGLEDFATPYQDDVAVFSDDWDSHLKHIRIVLDRLRDAGLTIKAEKCKWGQADVVFLSHVIGQNCRRPDEAKTAAIRSFRRPTTKREIRSFLGLTGYYNHYIRNYADIASPLTDALKKNAPNVVRWNNKLEQAFENLKSALIGQNVLRSPNYSKEFIVQVDCSKRGMGVTLSQLDDENEEHPVLYLSKKLTPREQLYGASELECACLVWAVAKLRPYLYGSHFVIETDHNPLRWLSNISSKNDRLLRWSLSLQPLNFTVRYKKGTQNKNVDTLSRYF